MNNTSINLNPKYLFVFITLIFTIGATYEEILSDKNKQIEIIKKEIEDSRNLIKNNKAVISEIQGSIDSVSIEIKALNDFLKDYENDRFLSPEQIATESNSVMNLESEVVKIQNSFRNKIVNLYKHGKNYELELLLSSKTPNEYLRRNEYLQKFSQNRRKELLELRSKKFTLEEKKKMLTLSTSSKRFYIESKRKDKNSLEIKLKGLQYSKDDIGYQIKANEQQILFNENHLQNEQNFINNFSVNRKNFNGTKYSRINYSSDEIVKLKGSLNLPVDLGLKRFDFGEYFNNTTNTRIVNNGIDFNISKGSKVFAVSSGIITLIGETPFYGKIIIIQHDNDFRSVYASLNEVSVNIGDKVRTNQVIAKSGETLEGQGMHFEIWQGKIALNPNEWIRFK